MEKLPIFEDDHRLPRVEPEHFAERIAEHWSNFIDTYRSNVTEYYNEQYLEDPDNFPFQQKLPLSFTISIKHEHANVQFGKRPFRRLFFQPQKEHMFVRWFFSCIKIVI